MQQLREVRRITKASSRNTTRPWHHLLNLELERMDKVDDDIDESDVESVM